ncbi:MAG: beta strand repeat-containing protein, partial [Actinomycetota bacterium]
MIGQSVSVSSVVDVLGQLNILITSATSASYLLKAEGGGGFTRKEVDVTPFGLDGTRSIEPIDGSDGILVRGNAQVGTVQQGNRFAIYRPEGAPAVYAARDADGNDLSTQVIVGEKDTPAGKELAFMDQTGVVVDVADGSAVATVAYFSDRAAYTYLDDTGNGNGVVETQWQSGASMVVDSASTPGTVVVYTVSPRDANGTYTTGSFVLNGNADGLAPTADGRVTLPGGMGTIDPRTATMNVGETSFAAAGNTQVTIGGTPDYPQLTIGGSTLHLNGGADSLLAIGGSVVTIPAGSHIAEVTGGGFTVAPPAGGETSFSAPGGTRFTLSGSDSVVLSGEGGFPQVTIGGSTLHLNADADSLLAVGGSVVTIPAGSEINRSADGGFSIVPPSGVSAAISGAQGSVVFLEPGQPLDLSVTGAGALRASIPGDNGPEILALGSGGDISRDLADGGSFTLPVHTATYAGSISSQAVDALIGDADVPVGVVVDEYIDQALSEGTQAQTIPDTSDATHYATWARDEAIDEEAEMAGDGRLDGRQQRTIVNLASDPSMLALESSYSAFTALRGAVNQTSTAGVLLALQAALSASSAIGSALQDGFLQSTAEQLGMTADPVTGQSAGSQLAAFVNEGSASLATLASLVTAAEHPSIRNVAAASYQALKAGMVFDTGFRADVAAAMGVSDLKDAATGMSQLDGLMAGGGVALSLVAAVDNPTPETVAAAAGQVLTAVGMEMPIPAVNAIASAIGLIQNPSVEGGIGTALWVAACVPGPQQPFVFVAAAVFSFFSGGGKPIVLDLDGNGIQMSSVGNSTAFYDLDGDGQREHRGWIGAGDALLAIDANGDGSISGRDEISFVNYRQGARTDLEGLIAFDSNIDGLLSSDDREWGRFRVWQDADGDGISDPGELLTMEQAGIASVTLASDQVRRSYGGNESFGEGTFTRTDGTTGIFADASFGTDPRENPSASSSHRAMVLNLTGGKVHTLADSAVAASFDMDRNGAAESTGWINPNEGFLVHDLNANWHVDNASELIAGFDQLATLDTNHDGKFNGLDADWSHTLLWVDKNMDGLTQKSELYSLDQLGIAAIDVAGNGRSRYDNGNIVHADGAFAFTDGSKGWTADVGLMSGSLGNMTCVTDDATTMRSANGQVVEFVHGSGLRIDLGLAGVDVIVDSDAGGNVLIGGDLAEVLVGTAHSTLIGGGGNDILTAKGASNTLIGGAGDDIYIVKDVGNVVTEKAGEGADEIQTTLNSYSIASIYVENLSFIGEGDFIGVGNTLGNTLVGGAGNDTLTGGGGADFLVGGQGGDTVSYSSSLSGVTVNLSTGAGQGGDAAGDILEGIENIAGSAYADVLIGDAGDNILVGGGGADVFDGGAGYDVADLHASGTYVINQLAQGFTAQANGDTLQMTSIEALRFGQDLVIGALGTSATVSIAAGVTAVSVSSSTIRVDANGYAALTGGRNTISLGAGAGMNVIGSANKFDMTSDGRLGVDGSNTKVTGYGTGNWVAFTGRENTVDLTGGTVKLCSGADATVIGTGNEVIETDLGNVAISGDGNSLDIIGTGNTATIGNGTVTLGAGASGTITGTGNLVAETGNGTVTVVGTGNTVAISGAGNAVTISSGSVALAAEASAVVTGSGNAIAETGRGTLTVVGTGDTVTVSGTNNVATISDGTVSVSADGYLTLNGYRDQVALA